MKSDLFLGMLKENCIQTNNTSLSGELPLTEQQAQCLIKWILESDKNDRPNIIKKVLRDITQSTYENKGSIWEDLIYSYLSFHKIPFKMQYQLSSHECYKSGEKGYKADGVFQIAYKPPKYAVFEIKSFNLPNQMLNSFRTKLEQEYDKLQGKEGIPKGSYIFTVGGSLDISNQTYEKDLFSQAENILVKLFSSKNPHEAHGSHRYQLSYRNLEITAEEPSDSSPIVGISYAASDIYEWAQNSEYRFLKHSSQFCYTKPFILICPFEPEFTSDDMIHKYRTEIALRALCRRIFIHLPQVHDRYIYDLDSHARKGISVAMAARKITAIMFIDISCNDPQKCDAWAFINPNGDNKLLNYQINTLFKSFNAVIDKFEYDNY